VPTSSRLAVARRLVEQHGLTLFPLREGGKLPAIEGWQEAATQDDAKLEKWFGKGARNIGVSTGASGLIVLDTDQKGVDGDANLRALAAEHAIDLDNTFTVESPTGSRHYYFRGSPVRNSVGKLAPAVDVRSQGGLVVAPGSVTEKGTYRVIRNVPIADIPQWLVDAISRAYVQVDKVEIAGNIELDTPASYSTAIAFLNTAEVAIQGQGGNDTTYRVACRLKDLGLSADGALDAMDLLSDWNTRCVPPWDRDELAEVVAHAYSYGENSPGSASVELEFEDIPDEIADKIGATEEAAKPGRITILFDHEIKAGKGKRRVYVIKGVLSEGDLGIIFGKPGAGKSLIAPYIARMIAQGKHAFGRRTRPGTVFYVAAEDPTGMTERVEALQLQVGEAADFALICGVSNLTEKKGPDLVALVGLIKQYNPKVIIIDTLSMAFPGIDENTAEGMGRVVAVCRMLASKGAAVILIHHDTKAEGDTPRGHSLLDGALDMKLKLIKDDNSGVISGKLGKNRNGSLEWFPAFRIGISELGVDEDGDKITAAYADEIKGTAPKKKDRLPATTKAALDILIGLDQGTGVDKKRWRDACCGNVSAVSAADDYDTRARVWRRCMQELLARGMIAAVGERIVLAGNAEDFDVLKDDPFMAEHLET
jgi:archaellum biogenesis ATPase FlaH